MLSKSAISKLQAILIIDIIVVASAAAGYFYVSSLPGPELSPAQIQLMGLQVTPPTGLVGQSVTVSINVTNTGGETGTFTVNLMLDGTQNQAQSVKLVSGETKTIQFTVSGEDEGTHLVGVGSLEGTFILTSTVELSDLAINRTAAKIGEPIGISVKVTNKAQEGGDYSVTLLINDSATQTKTGHIEGGTTANVLFEVVEQTEGTYQFKIGSLNGTFTISPSAAPPKPAEFQVSNLTIDPEVADPGTAVNVTAKVINVGETSGSYSADFSVNDAVKDTKTLTLSGGETATVTFTVTETGKGNYTIKIGNATGTLSIQAPTTITLTNLIVRPYEVSAGQIVTVTAKGNNNATDVSSLSVKLKVGTQASDMKTIETKTLTLAALAEGSVDFTVTAAPLPGGDSLTYLVDVNGIQGGFMVVKSGYHTFNVEISPRGDADFNITYPDGHQEKHTTFWTALLPEGTYTVTMPLTDPTGRITFVNWEDESTSLSHTITLTSRMTVTATYTGGSSCPVLYMWNGTDYVYVSDVSNHGWLGYINYINDDGSITYYRNNPWDYIPLNSSQLQSTDGNFNLTLVQKYNEIFYLDQAYMLAVDHPANVSVYSTMVEQYLDPNYMGNIYTISNVPLTPVSAVNEKGENVLPQISKIDGVFTSGGNGIQSPAWDNITWNRVTLDLGNLTGAQQIKLVVRAIVDWGSGDDYNNWLNTFFAQPIPNGTEVTPPPYMEVKDANGNWVHVPQSRDFPLPSDGAARTYVVDLTGLFPTNNYSLRISNFWNVTFDYIAIDTTPQQNVTIQKIDPQAYLYQAFEAGTAAATGNLTQYGNVTQLLLKEDDMFVIGRHGDAVSLQFPTGNLSAPGSGMVRDYFLYEACWFKGENGNWGFGFGFTVDPLPFQNMSGFPYLPSESYPNDTAHQNYLQQWNTRTIEASATPQKIVSSQNGFPIIALPTVAFAAAMVYVNFKLGAFNFRQLRRPKRI